MSIYKGIPTRVGGGGYLVLKDGNPLSPARSQAVVNHSPDGFMWGYGGSGPAQLALALLLEEGVGNKDNLPPYQDFKWSIIAKLPIDEEWTMTSEEIKAFISSLQAR